MINACRQAAKQKSSPTSISGLTLCITSEDELVWYEIPVQGEHGLSTNLFSPVSTCCDVIIVEAHTDSVKLF